jgi:hypothetical protein
VHWVVCSGLMALMGCCNKSHKAASEVRYVLISNNGSTTGPNGVSELGLARATRGRSAYY